MIKNLHPQLAERGKIKIGKKGKKKTTQYGKEMAQPEKLDHFLITTMQRDDADQLIPDTALMDHLKKEQNVQKLTEIPIRLLYDDNELNFQTRLSCYKKLQVNGKEKLMCWCSGDNEKALRRNNQGKYEEVACPCERKDPAYPAKDKCKYLGTLQCLIDGTSRVGGVWRFRTTGYNSVNAIIASMNMIKTLTGGGQMGPDGTPVGPLAGIPLKMMVSPKSTITPDGIPTIIWVVHLEFDGLDERLREMGLDIMRKRIDHRMKMGELQKQARRLLIAPHEEPVDEQIATAEEFFPEAVTESGSEQPPGQDIPTGLNTSIMEDGRGPQGPVIEAEPEEIKDPYQDGGKPPEQPKGADVSSPHVNEGKAASNHQTTEMVLVTTISPSKAFKILKANGIQARIEPSGKIYYQAADEAKVKEIFPNDANPKARSQSEEGRLLEPDDASKANPLGLEGSAVSDKVYQETQRTDPAEEEVVPPGYDGLPAAAHTMNTRNTQRTKGASRERLF